jgi:hypothetical protein
VTRVAETKALVEEILDDIDGDEHRDRWVPHGFMVASVVAAMAPSYFPEGAEHIEVKLRIEVPVIFSARNNRAVLPAKRENLNGLQAWIEQKLVDRATRLELSDWNVSPIRDPEPKREAPDPMWTVDAVIRER